jgi:hypothetical protein
MNDGTMRIQHLLATVASEVQPTQKDWLDVFELCIANVDSVDALLWMETMLNRAIQYEKQDVS